MPAHTAEGGDKTLKFRQHPVVNGRIGDDPPPFIHFQPAGFKLRFDQRDYFAVCL